MVSGLAAVASHGCAQTSRSSTGATTGSVPDLTPIPRWAWTQLTQIGLVRVRNFAMTAGHGRGTSQGARRALHKSRWRLVESRAAEASQSCWYPWISFSSAGPCMWASTLLQTRVCCTAAGDGRDGRGATRAGHTRGSESRSAGDQLDWHRSKSSMSVADSRMKARTPSAHQLRRATPAGRPVRIRRHPGRVQLRAG
jgi:hypothetical protein